MKNSSVTIILISIFLFSCLRKDPSSTDIVTNYYQGFSESDFEQVRKVIADSITIEEGEFVMPYSIETFYEQFKWDSVFQPAYKIIELELEGTEVLATVSSSSLRYAFLKHNPLTCQYRFSFVSGRIQKIEVLDCPEADWNIWQQERDSLVNWISINHPNLDGFVHDLSMKGAMNYLQAIELYSSREIGY